MVRTAWTIFVLIPLLHQTSVRGQETYCDDDNQKFCLPENYFKSELPVEPGVNDISVSIDIDEVLSVNDKDMSITIACYFNIKWNDKRIIIDSRYVELDPPTNLDIFRPANLELIKSLWMPNIFIYNLLTYKPQDVLSKMNGLWITANRVVLYSESVHITFVCPMQFEKFPMDTQRCKFRVLLFFFI